MGLEIVGRVESRTECGKKKIYPFSNGSQFMDWAASNCDRCKKSTESGDFTCDIQKEISYAAIDDGSVSEDIAKRMGYSDPLLYCWMCTEVEWTDEWKELYQAKHPKLPIFE